MPFVPVEEVVRVAITYNDTAGNEAVNVIHCKTDEFPVQPTVMNDLLDAIETWLTAHWAVTVNNQWTAVRLEALNLTVADSYYISRVIDIQGEDTSSAMPPQDTIAISLRSMLSGRSRRGRLYHVGLSESQQDGGYITSTVAEGFVTLYEQLLTAISGVNWIWGVVSYVADGVPRSEGLFTTISYIVVTDLLVDSMDSRKPKL